MAPMKAVFAGFGLLPALPSVAVVHEARGADSSDGPGAGRRAFLATTSALRPEFVAQLLMQVEDDWKKQAGQFISCNKTLGTDAPCNAARRAFDGSCFKVVGAVLGGSGGDKERSTEYLGDICRQPSLQGWKRDKCNSFAHDMLAAMSENSFSNRNFFNPSSVCSGLWSNFAAEEKLLLAEAEQAKAREHLEAARKAEVARVKAEQERVEAAKKAKEEALKAAIKAAAERKNKELQEQRMAEEAKIKAEIAARERAEKERQKEVHRKEEEAVRQAEEAKKAAEQAAARLKAKKEEAAKEEAAEAAARKVAEAAELKIRQLKAKKVLPSKSPRNVQTSGATHHSETIKNVTVVNKASNLSMAVNK